MRTINPKCTNENSSSYYLELIFLHLKICLEIEDKIDSHVWLVLKWLSFIDGRLIVCFISVKVIIILLMVDILFVLLISK